MTIENHSESGINWDSCFYGSATVGDRGQIVIPVDARENLGYKPGDRLIVMRHPIYAGLMIAKFEAIQSMVDGLSRNISRAKEEETEG